MAGVIIGNITRDLERARARASRVHATRGALARLGRRRGVNIKLKQEKRHSKKRTQCIKYYYKRQSERAFVFTSVIQKHFTVHSQSE